MANYYATCRSNYVRVKNPKRFKDILSEYDLDIIEDDDGRIGFLSRTEDGFPRMLEPDEHDEHGYINDDTRIPECLHDDEVLVIMEIGNEKMRYLIGYALAINSDGRQCSVSLDEIYSRAEANFGNKPKTPAEY